MDWLVLSASRTTRHSGQTPVQRACIKWRGSAGQAGWWQLCWHVARTEGQLQRHALTASSPLAAATPPESSRYVTHGPPTRRSPPLQLSSAALACGRCQTVGGKEVLVLSACSSACLCRVRLTDPVSTSVVSPRVFGVTAPHHTHVTVTSSDTAGALRTCRGSVWRCGDQQICCDARTAAVMRCNIRNATGHD